MKEAGNSSHIKNSQRLDLSRRKVLFATLFLGLGALFLKTTSLMFSFLKPPVKKNSFGGTIHVGNLAELPAQGAPPKHIPQGRFWLIHGEQGVSALHSSCTHLDCLFTWDKGKNCFVCPCHGSEFSTEGELLKGPATRSLDRFPVTVVDKDSNLIRGNDQLKGGPVQISDLLKSSTTGEEENNQGQQSNHLAFLQVDTGTKISGPTVS